MINFKDYLTEGRDAPLFHGTSIKKLIGILTSNMIVAKSDHEIDGKWLYGVSTTRHLEFAKAWSKEPGGLYWVLELDQAKLAQNYKIKPFNYFGGLGTNTRDMGGAINAMKFRDKHASTQFPHGFANQMEENIIGTIKNLDRYLISIITNDLNLFTNNENDKLHLYLEPDEVNEIINKFKDKVKYIGKWADD